MLPIDPLLPGICDALRSAGSLVLQAEPGAGKTTRVPLALMERGVAGDGQVLVLEPRRVAARAAADFTARALGEEVGQRVGYQVRFERVGGSRTRLWFVTEGVALRRLAADPFLENVGVLVLDEFHERHLAGDTVLALARELQRTVRPDLRVLVMSATLDVDRVAQYLGECESMLCPGRVHPVSVEYRAGDRYRRLSDNVVDAVRAVTMEGDDGDILVFLPGRGEIRWVGEGLANAGLAERFDVVALYGDLPLAQQRSVLRPDRVGGAARRIVLATNVAESSVTVEGVRTVIDSGLARVPVVDPERGVQTLRSTPISVASADQRAGRAGRQGPGRCVRLWSKHDHAGRRQRDVPEIRRLDLSSTVLDLRAWGLRDLRSLEWLDDPPKGALTAADSLLESLGAYDTGGGLSEIGVGMARLPAPPRAARLTLAAARMGQPTWGALLAALMMERDLLLDNARDRSGDAACGSDLIARAELFAAAAAAGFSKPRCQALGVEPGAARSVDRAARHLIRAAGARGELMSELRDDESLLVATMVAFVDRLARRRAKDDPRAVMTGGTGIRLGPRSVVRAGEFFVCVDALGAPRGQRGEAVVSIASVVELDWLRERYAPEIVATRVFEMDEKAERVMAVERESLRGLVLRESRTPASAGEGREVLLAWARAHPDRVVAWSVRQRRAVPADRLSAPRRWRRTWNF